jgi:hypothetical protein
MEHGTDIEQDGSTGPPEHSEVNFAAPTLGVSYLHLHQIGSAQPDDDREPSRV